MLTKTERKRIKEKINAYKEVADERKDKKTGFLIEEVGRLISSLKQDFMTEKTEESDDEIQRRKIDIPDKLKMM